ncbi:RNA 2',3'-cyclic phosphodiesterase [Luteipulveratus flavus]|uniref:RNA 2',3'-cyclic phosphodiesterase n=1 Tax=Luteipulveratus flavus TaxID=3031728 RepID=A0ABT6C5C7_9MICO|nr:RNA 2',3'-cyclic phosphodiesterase [Luteipulveratus sp. YIM 133296]MDF8263502.1 RNA 2',3'-cyclic phosphodiesterase [Luteipulveratus sp. YIM 133296]
MGRRMFVAVVPPEPVQEDLAAFLEPRAEHPWIAPEQWHITLAFMSDVSASAEDRLVEGLEAAAARRTSMRLQLAGAGAFPDPWAAKVLWVGVRGDVDELGRLARNVRNSAQHAGATPDGQAFAPHLTVSRLRRVQEQTRWVRVLDTYEGPSWVADEICLIASELGVGPHGRPRYEIVATAGLG